MSLTPVLRISYEASESNAGGSVFSKCLGTLALALGSILGFSASAVGAVKWGKVVCVAVGPTDAVEFAHRSPFIYGDSLVKTPVGEELPYVAPKGTLSCTLPFQIRADLNSDGTTFYDLDVYQVGVPFKLPKCQVRYFDGSKSRSFRASGSGEGWAGMTGSEVHFDVVFSDDGNRKYTTDTFIVTEVSDQSITAWAPEAADARPSEPIVTGCHVEL